MDIISKVRTLTERTEKRLKRELMNSLDEACNNAVSNLLASEDEDGLPQEAVEVCIKVAATATDEKGKVIGNASLKHDWERGS